MRIEDRAVESKAPLVDADHDRAAVLQSGVFAEQFDRRARVVD
jgi:hypothetical protein